MSERPPAAATVRTAEQPPLRGARSGVIGLIGAAANGACSFLLTLVVVRVFGADGSGALFTAIALVSILGVLCCLGADTGLVWALPRRTPGPAGDAARLLPVAVLPTLALATLVAGAGWAAAGALAPALFDADDADTVALVRLAFVGVPAFAASTVLLAAVRATRPVTAYVGVQLLFVPALRPALVGAGVLVGGAAGGGVALGLAGWLLPPALAAGIALLIISGPLGLTAGAALRPQPDDWRAFWTFALPRAVSATIDASSMWVGVLATSALAGQAEAGVFAAVGRYALAGLLVMQGLRVVAAARLSRLLGAGRLDEAAQAYRRTTLVIVLLSWPAYLLLAVFAPAFLDLFGAGFAAGSGPLAVLAAAMGVNVGVGLVQTVLLMGGDSRAHLRATLAGLVVNVAGGLLLIPDHGALGAAVAWSLGIVTENVVAAVCARRLLGRPLTDRALWRAAAVAVGAAGVACVAGVWIAGRELPGLGVALGVLAAGGLAAAGTPRARAAVAAGWRPPPTEAGR